MHTEGPILWGLTLSQMPYLNPKAKEARKDFESGT